MNVADEATKTKTHTSISSSDRWFVAPEFLLKNEEAWPIRNDVAAVTEERRVHVMQVKIKGNATPNPKNISKWATLVRSQARILRVLKKHKASDRFEPEELQEAEKEIFRACQLDAFSDELNLLSQDPPQPVPKNSPLWTLSPFMDPVERILRIQGRICKAEVTEDLKYPIILPKGHRITHLLIRSYHVKYVHQNFETVVNELRQRFWISALRVELRKVVSRCPLCRIRNAKPIAPMMGNLPFARVAANTRPFTFTGLDYFGPIYVTVRRSTEKRWVALFTCLTTRAIQLEIADTLTATSVLICLTCLIAKRGVPQEIWSDNGSNFRCAAKELRTELDKLNMSDVTKEHENIKWKFITPAAPNMGGAWQRLVRSVKNSLQVILKDQRPTTEVLKGALAEVELIINSRPLTYMSVGQDGFESITPNHILLGSSDGTKPPGILQINSRYLYRVFIRSQQLATQFWIRWVNEYLPTLTRRTKWHKRATPVRIGNIGILWDLNVKNSWQLGRVEKVIQAKDGQTRSVEVRTSKGLYLRPTSKFAILDLSTENAEGDSSAVQPNHKGENVIEECGTKIYPPLRRSARLKTTDRQL